MVSFILFLMIFFLVHFTAQEIILLNIFLETLRDKVALEQINNKSPTKIRHCFQLSIKTFRSSIQRKPYYLGVSVIFSQFKENHNVNLHKYDLYSLILAM